jgi:hypothetical protein
MRLIERLAHAGVLSFAALALCSSSGCTDSNSKKSDSCASSCEVGCRAAQACGLSLDLSECTDSCTKANAGLDCSDAEPLDRLTCAQLEREFACVGHCTALCKRAAQCATFEEEQCMIGCSVEHGSVCNEASVAARSCDQIKKEAQVYDFAGGAIKRGDAYGVGSSGPASLGLCEGASDCEPPLACTLATNTCGECETDAECQREYSTQAYACSARACVAVACNVDDDCLGSKICDSASHSCVDCRTSADCGQTLLSLACDVATSTCVQCVSNADCARSPLGAINGVVCDVKALRCVECLGNADCRAEAPRCDVVSHLCLPD